MTISTQPRPSRAQDALGLDGSPWAPAGLEPVPGSGSPLAHACRTARVVAGQIPVVVVVGPPAMGVRSVARAAADDVVSAHTAGTEAQAGEPPRLKGVAEIAAEVVATGVELVLLDGFDDLPPSAIEGLRSALRSRAVSCVVLAASEVVPEMTGPPPALSAEAVTWVRLDAAPPAATLAIVAEAAAAEVPAADRALVTAVCAGRRDLARAVGRQLRITGLHPDGSENVRAACARATADLAQHWLPRLPDHVRELGLLALLASPDVELATAAALLGLSEEEQSSSAQSLHLLGLHPSAGQAQAVALRAMLSIAEPAELRRAAGTVVGLLERLDSCPHRRMTLMGYAGITGERYTSAARLAVTEAQGRGAGSVARRVVHEALVRSPSPSTFAWANEAMLELSLADHWDLAAATLIRGAGVQAPIGTGSVTRIPTGFALEAPAAMSAALTTAPTGAVGPSGPAGADGLSVDAASETLIRLLVAGSPLDRQTVRAAHRPSTVSRSIELDVCHLATLSLRGGAVERRVEALHARLRAEHGILGCSPRAAMFVAVALLGLADHDGALQWATLAQMSTSRAEPTDLGLAHLVGAQALLRLGRFEHARQEAQVAGAVFVRAGAAALASAARATVVHSDVEAGRVDAADLERLAETPGMHPLLRAQLAYVRGRVELARGRVVEAVPLLLDTGRILGSVGLANPTLLNWRPHLASVFAATDQPQLSDAVTAESVGALVRWARANPEAARRRGAQLGIHVPAPGARAPEGDATLSEAERRVIDLVVAGHSSSAVARQLFLSKRTVETHLNRVYRRFGVHSRDELRAALAGPATPEATGAYG